MNICIEYKKNFKYINEINEFTINVSEEHLKTEHRAKSLKEFLIKYKNKRINIRLKNNQSLDSSLLEEDFINAAIPFFSNLIKEYNLKLFFIINKSHYHKFKKEGLNYFFELTQAYDWDIFTGLIVMGVSDIYVTNSLGFDLKNVSKIAKKYKIKLRTYPNVCQSSFYLNKNNFKNFWIRPEDLEYYSQYIDTFEFWNKELIANIDLLYKIYIKDQKWDGNLQNIIQGLQKPLDSRNINNEAFRIRSYCEKKCLKGFDCFICDRANINSFQNYDIRNINLQE